jgi:hypothetical protein
VPPLLVDPGSTGLKDALTEFFTNIVGVKTANIKMEIGASLVWRKGVLSLVTPFVVMPWDIIDVMNPGGDDGSYGIYTKCTALLGAGTPKPPNVDQAWIRLRLKITGVPIAGQEVGATLLEIAAIDFPL